MPVIGAFCHRPVDGVPLKLHRGTGKAIPFMNIFEAKRACQSKGREMEGEKRKNKDGEAVSGTARKKPRDRDAGEMAVNEEEVEEFYAILRRIRAAVTYFEKSTGDGRRPATKGSTWREGLENEILEEVKKGAAGGAKLKRIEDAEENVGFDLNADPDSGENAVHVDFV